MKKRILMGLSLFILLFTMVSCENKTKDSIYKEDENEKTEESQEANFSLITEDTNKDIHKKTLLEEKDIEIIFLGVDTNSFLGTDILLEINNHSNDDITIQSRNSYANDFMMDTILSADIKANSSSKESITFTNIELEKAGIEEIYSCGTSFHIFKSKSWDTILDSKAIDILEGEIPEENFPKEKKKLLVDEKGLLIYLLEGKDKTSLGPSGFLYIENNRDKNIHIQSKPATFDFSDEEIKSYCSIELLPHKKIISSITFSNRELKKLKQKPEDTLYISFMVYEENNIEPFLDTKEIEISFN